MRNYVKKVNDPNKRKGLACGPDNCIDSGITSFEQLKKKYNCNEVDDDDDDDAGDSDDDSTMYKCECGIHPEAEPSEINENEMAKLIKGKKGKGVIEVKSTDYMVMATSIVCFVVAFFLILYVIVNIWLQKSKN